jgi:hypothetical protein
MKRENVQIIRWFCLFLGLQQAESDETEKQVIVSKEKKSNKNTDLNKAHHPQRIFHLFIL